MRFGIIDLSSLVHPFWHAVRPKGVAKPDIEYDSQGNGIDAVLRVLGYIKELREGPFTHTHLVVCADRGHDHRRALLPEYKVRESNLSEENAADLKRQLLLAERLCEALGVPVVAVDGYEADDCIASLVSVLEDSGRADQVVIHTSDKDCYQLLSDRTVMYTRKGGTFSVDDLLYKHGIYPIQVVDWQALRGDPVDGVPGVEKCGPKLATALIEKYFDLTSVYGAIEEIRVTPKIVFKGSTVAERLEASRENAFLSRKLCRLVNTLELPVSGSATVLPREQPNISDFLAELRDPS